MKSMPFHMHLYSMLIYVSQLIELGGWRNRRRRSCGQIHSAGTHSYRWWHHGSAPGRTRHVDRCSRCACYRRRNSMGNEALDDAQMRTGLACQRIKWVNIKKNESEFSGQIIHLDENGKNITWWGIRVLHLDSVRDPVLRRLWPLRHRMTFLVDFWTVLFYSGASHRWRRWLWFPSVWYYQWTGYWTEVPHLHHFRQTKM